MELMWYTIRSIIALIGVIWLINFLLKKLNNFSIKRTRTIEIIERASLSKTSSLAIVKIIDDFYVMSIHENTTEIIEKLTLEEKEKLQEKLKEQEIKQELKEQELNIPKKIKEFYEKMKQTNE